MWPIQLAYLLFIVFSIFLPSNICATSSFLTRSIPVSFSILLQNHFSKLPRYFWCTFRNLQVSARVLCTADNLSYLHKNTHKKVTKPSFKFRKLSPWISCVTAVLREFLVLLTPAGERKYATSGIAFLRHAWERCIWISLITWLSVAP